MLYRSKDMFYGAPAIVKKTVLITVIMSLFSLICAPLFTKIFHTHSLQNLLSLTTWGIHRFFIWQFLSYLFIYPVFPGGVSIGFLLQIFFNMTLLWTTGCAIIQNRGTKHFIGLYFGGGLFIGLIAYLSLLFFNSSLPFAGPACSIDILLIGWVFLFPKMPISFFFLMPMPAKWLIFGFIGMHLFLDFSNGNFLSLFVTAGALFYGYFYSVLVWDSLSPFTRLHLFEKKMIYLKRKIFSLLTHMFDRKNPISTIYDFKTGQRTLHPENVIHLSFEKISQKEAKAESFRKRFRMKRLFKKNN